MTNFLSKLTILRFKNKSGAIRLDGHIVFLLACFVVLGAFIFYLKSVSQGEYLVEKYKYAADQIASKINLETASEEDLSKVIRAYRKAISKQPLSTLSGRCHMTIVQIRMIRQEFDLALEELKTVINNFSKKARIAGEARFAVAKIYEQKGDWENALKAFDDLLFHNSLSPKGLLTPIYIAEYYKTQGMTKEASEAYEKAIKHYQYKLNEFGDISHAVILHNFIALTYSSQGLWQKAASTWEAMLEKYPKSDLIPSILLSLGETYSVRLKERSRAAVFYERLLKDHPRSKFAFEGKVRLVQLYFFTSDFEKARYWCREVLKDKNSTRSLKAEISLILARTFEKEGNWEEAEKMYDTVKNKYADTMAALRVPIIKAKHFESEENIDEANKLYGQALIEYQKLAGDGDPDSILAVNAQDLISLTYVTQKDWPALLHHLDNLRDTTDSELRKGQLLFLKADIVEKKLNDPSRALALYREFLQAYPHHDLVPLVRKRQIDIAKINKDLSRLAKIGDAPEQSAIQLEELPEGAETTAESPVQDMTEPVLNK